jgi:uncharacterized protein involved in exopolysaccharide biosynthesis
MRCASSSARRQRGGIVSAGILTPTDARLQQMQLRLDELLMRYTDKHPEVRQIRGLMEELEAQRDAELAG